MAVTVTNTTLVRDTVNTGTANAATADVANTAEVFTITLAKGTDRAIIEIDVANTNGTVACSIAAGGATTGYWARKALTWNAVQNKTSIMHISDVARFEHATTGAILLTLTPNTGQKLLTDHAAVVRVIELP